MQTSYITAAKNANKLPVIEESQVAIIGRSNCGKSSLLNALLGARLARKSQTPGRTQMLHFFRAQQKDNTVVFCDLPGWGFSKTSASVRNSWQQLIDGYFAHYDSVRVLLCLLDIRRDFVDKELIWLQKLVASKRVVFVFTKSDKVKRNELNKRQKILHEQLVAMNFVDAKTFTVSVVPRLKGVQELKEQIFSSL